MRRIFLLLGFFVLQLAFYFQPASVFAACNTTQVEAYITALSQKPPTDPYFDGDINAFHEKTTPDLTNFGCEQPEIDTLHATEIDAIFNNKKSTTAGTPVPTLARSAVGKQFFPNPGLNCGAGYYNRVDPNDRTPPNLSVEENNKFMCCEKIITSQELAIKLPDGLENFRVVGPMIKTLNTVVDPAGYPKSINSNLPALRDLEQKADEQFPIQECVVNSTPKTDPTTNSCYCEADAPGLSSLLPYCFNIKSESERVACAACMGYEWGGDTQTITWEEWFRTRGEQVGSGSENDNFVSKWKRIDGPTGIWTGMGCLRTDLSVFIRETLFGLGIGFAGLVSFLCIIYASFLIQTSAGNPERLKKAQELLTSCITGLMMVLFSVVILRLIGVTILRIPGFS